MRVNPRIWTTVFWMLLFAVLLVNSTEWPETAARFPRTVGLAGLVLCVVQFGIDVYRSIRPSPQDEDQGFIDVPVDKDIPGRVVTVRAGVFLAWLLGFMFLVWLAGFLIAIPVFVGVYGLVYVRTPFWAPLALAAGAGAFVYVVFDYFLRIPWPESVFSAFT